MPTTTASIAPLATLLPSRPKRKSPAPCYRPHGAAGTNCGRNLRPSCIYNIMVDGSLTQARFKGEWMPSGAAVMVVHGHEHFMQSKDIFWIAPERVEIEIREQYFGRVNGSRTSTVSNTWTSNQPT